MFKNRRLFKDFVSGVREHRYTTREAICEIEDNQEVINKILE